MNSQSGSSLHYTHAIQDKTQQVLTDRFGLVVFMYKFLLFLFSVFIHVMSKKVWPNLCTCSLMISWSKIVAFSLRLGWALKTRGSGLSFQQVQNSKLLRLPLPVWTVQDTLEKKYGAIKNSQVTLRLWAWRARTPYCRFFADNVNFVCMPWLAFLLMVLMVIVFNPLQSTEKCSRKSFTSVTCKHKKVYEVLKWENVSRSNDAMSIHSFCKWDCHQTVKFEHYQPHVNNYWICWWVEYCLLSLC